MIAKLLPQKMLFSLPISNCPIEEKIHCQFAMMCGRRDCAWIRLDGLRFKILTKLPLVGWSGVDQLADQEVFKNNNNNNNNIPIQSIQQNK